MWVVYFVLDWETHQCSWHLNVKTQSISHLAPTARGILITCLIFGSGPFKIITLAVYYFLHYHSQPVSCNLPFLYVSCVCECDFRPLGERVRPMTVGEMQGLGHCPCQGHYDSSARQQTAQERWKWRCTWIMVREAAQVEILGLK